MMCSFKLPHAVPVRDRSSEASTNGYGVEGHVHNHIDEKNVIPEILDMMSRIAQDSNYDFLTT